MAADFQDEAHRSSLADPEAFWTRQAQQVDWAQRPSRALGVQTKRLALSGASHADWAWFPDGELSACFNCVDRHVGGGQGAAPAILYDSAVAGGARARITYAELLVEVETFAGVLREEGVGKGDVVLVYSMQCHKKTAMA
jgi:propionyl-CoA synthetase